jgi:MinD-like ATPase involved in chromosome partitioning or flagellar assembly/CheY-like chemotaxis protein
MLRLAVVTPNPVAADAIEILTMESGAFQPCYKITPVPHPKEIVRALTIQNPAIVLLDLGDWVEAAGIAREIQHNLPRTVIIGFRPRWDRTQQLAFEDAGILDLLAEPFSPGDIDAAAYEAVHRRYPVTHQNILPFVPAKAGGGCSTIALHVSAALAGAGKKVLLVEADQRSGPLSIMLNLERQKGLLEALEQEGEFMSPLEWRQVTQQLNGMDLLLSNPSRRGRLPSWADYFQLLLFVQKQYDYIVVDLPEVVNQATAEFVRNARAVFIVCQPELPSLKLAKLRRIELESCEIPADNVKLLVNRWEKRRFRAGDVEKAVEGPVFATLPNDYKEVRDSILEMRLASPTSPFGKACEVLAQNISALPESPHTHPKFTLLRKLGTIGTLAR